MTSGPVNNSEWDYRLSFFHPILPSDCGIGRQQARHDWMLFCCLAGALIPHIFFFFSEAPGCVCKTGATKWDYAAYPTMGLYDNQQETMGLYGGGFNGIMSLFIMVITQSVPCRDLTLALGPCVRMRGSNSLADKGWLAVGNGIIGIFK